MKKILRGTVAALALVSFAGVAQAQTNIRHYANPVLGPTGSYDAPYNLGEVIGIGFNELGLLAGVGTRYTVDASAPGNTETATPTVNVVFNLTGSVTKDCSFYSGNNAAARNIDFGVIGVRTGNNENVNDAFEMVGPAVANIESLTAGCNFNNTVTLTKTNGNAGMVNSAPGGYDSSQFQANIPYSVAADWTGIPVNTVGAGIPQSLAVATTQSTNQVSQGAWRSDFDLTITAPVAANALVAGTYSDTLTLTLAAL